MIRMKSPWSALCVLPAAFCLARGADLDSRSGAQSVPDFAAASTRRGEYRAELERFRNEFGGTRALPAQPFFIFGMGLRPKYLYKAGTLFRAESRTTFRQWEGAEEVIVPPDHAVVLRRKRATSSDCWRTNGGSGSKIGLVGSGCLARTSRCACRTSRNSGSRR